MRKYLGVFGTVMVNGLSLLIFSSSCLAAENSGGTSQATIRLVPNHLATSPKNPLDPTSEMHPSQAGILATNNRGPLSLDVVPQSIQFGQQKIYHEAHDYRATGIKKHLQYIQVTDNRPSEMDANGWQVLLRQTGPLTDNAKNIILDGAYIKLPAGIARNSNFPNGQDEKNSLKTFEVKVSTTDQVIFEADSDTSLLNGKATSVDAWNSDDVILHIPRGRGKEGNFSTTLYWTLIATTQN